MSSSDQELNIYLDEIEFYPSGGPLDFMEVGNFVDSGESIVNTGTLPEKDIEKWLHKEPLTQNGEHLCGGLQLLISSGCREEGFERPPVEIRRPTFVQIIKALRLPLAYVEAVARHGGMHVRLTEPAGGDQPTCIVYIIKPPPGGYHLLECAVSHCPSSGISRGFLRTNVPDAANFFRRRIAMLKEQASHPLFLAVVFAEWEREMISNHCVIISSMLVHTEALTGCNAVGNAPLLRTMGSRIVERTYYDPLRIDLSHINYRASVADVFAEGVNNLGTFALNSFELDLKIAPERRKGYVLHDTLELRQRLWCTMNSCSYSRLQIRMYEKRAQFQFNIIHNLIAQEESIRNIEVAKNMGSIAILTMIFLPGTFIASLFATSLFDWDAPSGKSVLKSGFWIFWAVTVPLTFVVMGAWWLWVRWRGGQDRAEDTSTAKVYPEPKTA